jgi:lipid A 3-O-deacylase
MVLRGAGGLRRPMFLNKRWGWIAFIVLAAAHPCLGRSTATNSEPPARYEWEYLSGVLWNVGGSATPLTYAVVPQILSLKIPPIFARPWKGGTLVLRSRFSLLVEPIAIGPEDVYLGLAAAGEFEWHHPNNRYELFFASGGGFGWMNSKGYEIVGAQGQDFNLNWLIHAGMRIRTSTNWRLSLGAYFQHISNRGMNDINPGLNSLGPTLAISRRF